jgi:hypothetical protein
MCGVGIGLVLFGLFILYMMRISDTDYQDGLEARRRSGSYDAGWNAGGSGCGGAFLVIVILGCLLVATCKR